MAETSRSPIALLALSELLAMSVWFSASAVLPALTGEWGLSSSGQAWLTMAVQLGFVVGAFGSAALNLADRIPDPLLFSASAILMERCLTWRWAFTVLAVGPAVGIWAMARLRRLPEAAKMACGRR